MPKLFVFDLDGVLLDSTGIHYDAFNRALVECGSAPLSREDHERNYNGLSTRGKLAKIPGVDADAVYQRKQEYTHLAMKNLAPSQRLQEAISGLKAKGYSVMCASNCIRDTVTLVLTSLGIHNMFDAILTNQDVECPKPSPDIYRKCMALAGVAPTETIIFEDSYVGLRAAVASGALVHRVANPADLTLEYVLSAKSNLMKHVNVVIPMAGNGSRFASVGYLDPKPLIPVFGQPMISWVVRNLGLDATYTFLIRKDFDHAREYLARLVPGCTVISIDSVTEGAACTVLLSKEEINNDAPLLMINSDQYIEFADCPTAFNFVFDFLYSPAELPTDGKISTFDGQRHPKWSYAKLGEDGFVTEVREKDPFSDHATTGMYLWRRGSDFVKYAEQMIAKNIRVNNEFYVVPTFNEAIADGKRIAICPCARMWGIGVPEDLEYFLKNYTHG